MQEQLWQKPTWGQQLEQAQTLLMEQHTAEALETLAPGIVHIDLSQGLSSEARLAIVQDHVLRSQALIELTRYQEAIVICQRSLDLHQQEPDLPHASLIQQNLIFALLQLKDWHNCNQW